MTPAVIMCGGLGLRLQNLTKNTPKPMLPVGDKPMLESVIEDFRDEGFREIWLCVYYKAEQIENYFKDGSKWGVKIKYTHEKEPLGTGGPINLLPKFDKPFIVMNADVDLKRFSFGQLMSFHGSKQPQATVCAALYQYQVPYGVLNIDEDLMTSLDEKPIHNFYINGGVYVLDPVVLNSAPRGRFDMPDLIQKLEKVAVYPIHTQWRDLGSFEDLSQARAECG